MAESPSHKFGQIIGNLLESIMKPLLIDFCAAHQLYLDYQGKDRTARKGKRVTWKDEFGNFHDLDYVIELNGTDTEIGQPFAFIEVAWRRYTKHSRIKAQEMQGAVLPVAELHQWSNPFLGAVLAGVFTTGSIEQLKSMGFQILYFQYNTIVEAFSKEGVDIAFDEATPDDEFKKCVAVLEQAPDTMISRVQHNLIESNQSIIDVFFAALEQRISRRVERILISPLYGRELVFHTLASALQFLDGHGIYEGMGGFRKYEVIVTFSNGDRAEGAFVSKRMVKDFLRFVLSQ